MKGKSNFEGCDDEFYSLAATEDYLFKYLEVKPANEEEVKRTKSEYINYSKEVTQRAVDCINKE